jgi:hypothetical protein
MKTLIASFILALATSTSIQAKADPLWNIRVYSLMGQKDYTPNNNGGEIPNTGFGLSGCKQEPIRIFRDTNNNLQEQVTITCKVGISSEVQLIETCYLNLPDSSFGAMRVKDSIENFTISVSCRTN